MSSCILFSDDIEVHHQAADWISPVNAARTASSKSASVKPRCSCRRAITRSRKTPRFSIGTRSGGGPDGPKLRIGEGEHVGDGLGSRRRLSTGAGCRPPDLTLLLRRLAACGARLCVFLSVAAPETGLTLFPQR